ncbi:DoxX family protein [Modestobacter altitudinis]|uniref:DoxX family protein n=1 Tax=Modestobacter altitudinis TaxID=2213158 RepID=UPI00110C9C1C|nr:DoxX family protein [Modestobacter altitudinis]
MTTTDTGRTRSAPAVARIGLLALRIGLAVLFSGAGLVKLGGEPAMVQMFADIGAGDWLRHLVGACEVAGAVGLLVPRLTSPAALGLTGLMIGATVTNVAVLDTSLVLTLVLALAAGTVAWVSSPGSRRR